MATKAQHADDYQQLPPFLRALREAAGLTQRELGDRLGRPQSWVYNCETGNRRVDVTEFAAWARGCGADPAEVFTRFVATLPVGRPRTPDRSGPPDDHSPAPPP